MEPIEVGKLDELLKRAENLMNRVEDTYLVAKDILMGTNVADWVEDLATSGKQSATYSDADRMNVLIANVDAVNNINVTQYLCDWAAANNKAGVYFGTVLGNVSGVTWDSLTTAAQVCGNAAAFTAIANNNTTISVSLSNSTMRQAMYNAYATTESILAASSVAMNVVRSLATTKNLDDNAATIGGTSAPYKMFMLEASCGSVINKYDKRTVTATLASGSQISEELYTGRMDERETWTVNRFVSKISINAGSSGIPQIIYLSMD